MDDCPICLDVLKEDVFITPCLHQFHNTCFTKFLQTSDDHRCPICRNPLQNNETNENDENDENWENIFRYEEHRRRANIRINQQRREEGRGFLNNFINVLSDVNTVASISGTLRRTQRIEPITESLINVIGPSVVRFFGNFLT
jgi:uncharacterized Zn finger protein (UPF0148 family)